MFQKAYRHGAILFSEPKEAGGGVLEGHLEAASGGDAALHFNKDKDVKRYPEPVEVLLIDESSLPTKHWEVGLQPKDFKVEEGRKPLEPRIIEKERISFEHQISKF